MSGSAIGDRQCAGILRTAPRETRRMKDDEIVHEDSSGIAAKKVDVTTEGVGGAARTRRGLAGGGDGSPCLPLNRVRRHRRRAPRARPGRIATAKEEGLKPRHVQEAHDAVERRGGRPGGVEDGSPHHIVLAHPLVQLDQGEGGIGPIAAQLRHERRARQTGQGTRAVLRRRTRAVRCVGARADRLSRVLSPFLSARLDVRGRTRHEEERQRRHDLIQCREWTSPKMEGLAALVCGLLGRGTARKPHAASPWGNN